MALKKNFKTKNLFVFFYIFERIFSLKSDFLPYLCKNQFSLSKKQIREINEGANNQKHMSPSKKPNKPRLVDYIRQEEGNYLANKMASNKLNHDMISVYAFVQADGFCYRNNTLAIYAESNRNVK